ncbi:uncharacterized protein LOC133314596 [Gastrolobium bilobum]|uniref:uncharacterized protein LOC133314596 n=1 Tax=Gastrolobium bilobum TaxID=150636 RepID=UPI002AB3024E|nr:uncharacterized protein LOC133314596 [Gastrolobium bilobum]
MAVNLIDASFKAKRYCNKKSIKHMPGSPLALCSEARYLIIRLPNSEFIKLCYRMLILALALASFTFVIKSSFIERISSASTFTHQAMSDSSLDHFNYDSVNMLFRDLTNEGLMKKTEQRAVFLSNNVNQQGETGSQVVTDYDMDIVPLNDLEKQNSVLDNTVDFIFTSNFPASSKFIERTLKTGGVVTVLMNDNPSTAFYKPSNYKIVYMRRFDSIAVAMKKTGGPVAVDNKVPNFSAAPRKLCGYASEAKKAALKNLEDVLLEPPRAASGKSRKYLKRTRYLPDLMGDSLESYPRRVFIDVGLPEKDGGSGTDWFPKNYPTRNKDFEIYKIETVAEEPSGKEVAQIGMSDWLRKNVKEEEYVVMKAEAEVVEEMMRSNSIGLVDELFLECKPRGNNGDRRSRRAYWECLALYGKLRDEGVAVHQWWG